MMTASASGNGRSSEDSVGRSPGGVEIERRDHLDVLD